MKTVPALPMPPDVKRLWDQILPPSLRCQIHSEWSCTRAFEPGDHVEFTAPSHKNLYQRHGRVNHVIVTHGDGKSLCAQDWVYVIDDELPDWHWAAKMHQLRLVEEDTP